MADVEGESPDFGELEPLGDELKPLGDELEPLGEEAEPSPLGELDAEELIPAGLEDLLSSEAIGPEATQEAALQTAAQSVEVAAEGETAGAEKAEPSAAHEEGVEEKAEEEKAKKPSKLMSYLDWPVAVGAAAILLILAACQMLNFSTAIYVISVGCVACAIWKGRRTSNIYTVLLGLCLIAILTSLYCLWLEMDRYQLDVKAREAKQRVSVSWPTEARFLA